MPLIISFKYSMYGEDLTLFKFIPYKDPTPTEAPSLHFTLFKKDTART